MPAGISVSRYSRGIASSGLSGASMVKVAAIEAMGSFDIFLTLTWRKVADVVVSRDIWTADS